MHDLARQEIVKIDVFHSDKHKFLLNVVQVVFDIPKLGLFINDCFQSILFSFSEEYDKQVVHMTAMSVDQKHQKDQKLLLFVLVCIQ